MDSRDIEIETADPQLRELAPEDWSAVRAVKSPSVETSLERGVSEALRFPMRRINVTGNAGTGKSTTARRLAEVLGIECVGLDQVVWSPRWRPTPSEERRRRELEIASRDRWVVDGVSRQIREAADTIVFLDYPRRVSFARCARRNFRYLFRSRPGLPEQCPEVLIIPTVIKLIWKFPRVSRPRILADFEAWRGEKNLVHIRSDDELEDFLRRMHRQSNGPQSAAVDAADELERLAPEDHAPERPVGDESALPVSGSSPTSTTVEFRCTDGRRLVGTMRLAESPCGSSGARMVVLAHGFTSDRLSCGRFPRLAEALASRGISSLAFDFGGCGESDDVVLSLQSQTEDLKAALAFVRARGFDRLAVVGHSLGSLACLMANIPDLKTMVLTGALTGPMHYRWSDRYSALQLEELDRTGRLVVPHDEGPRRETIVDAQLLGDFASVEPVPLLASIRCPVLLVLGDGDDEERRLLAHARNALPLLPDGSRLQIVAGAPHGFGGAYDQVIDMAVGWLARHLEKG